MKFNVVGTFCIIIMTTECSLRWTDHSINLTTAHLGFRLKLFDRLTIRLGILAAVHIRGRDGLLCREPQHSRVPEKVPWTSDLYWKMTMTIDIFLQRKACCCSSHLNLWTAKVMHYVRYA
jgi:hypothetical protein